MKEIQKIKYERKNCLVTIEYSIIEENSDDIKTTLKSSDEPREELVEALNQLAPYVESICCLPEHYCDMAEIRGVSFSNHNDVMGAVITALVPVKSANSPVVLNTPHLPASPYSEDYEAPQLPYGCVLVLKVLKQEVINYIEGHRKPSNQQSLDFPE